MQQHYDPKTKNIICPQDNTRLENIGSALGHISFGLQACVIIFPLLVLFDMLWFSSRNRCNLTKVAIYTTSIFFAVSRTSIAAYVENLNDNSDERWFNLAYVAVVIFFFHFFSTAIGGPSTCKTIANTIKQSFQGLQNYFCGAPEDGSEVLIPEAITVKKTLTACGKLQRYCLFRPGETNKILAQESPSEDSCINTFA